MKLSFIIPAWNEENTLKFTIANLRKTVGKHAYEIVVVDDHSDEELWKHIDLAQDLTYIRNAQRLGVAKSRNIGAKRATGDLFIFLDAHVCFSENWIERLYFHERFLRNSIVGMARYMLFDSATFQDFALLRQKVKSPAGKLVYGSVVAPLPTPVVRHNFLRKSQACFQVPIAGGAAFSIRRQLFFDLGCFENELTGFGGFEETELAMRCWALGYQVVVLPSVTCFHYYAPNKISVDGSVNYETRPFFSARYEHSVENMLRVLYLHLSKKRFQSLLQTYEDHPHFRPDLNLTITDTLRGRKEVIDRHRVLNDERLFERLRRV